MKQGASQTIADVLRLSATEMARQVATGERTSAELVEAHIARIEAVQPRLNALAVPMFEQARAAAAAADTATRSGQSLGPLHGVPISVKECFHVAGTAATEGIARFAGEIHQEDSPLVARLRAAGAIVLGKTNLPQLMLMHECDNPIFGRTNNPWNVDRVPGGSSGGEAALIAAGGSPLGLANDIGGSIRFPAHCCGIVGIKPTTLRLTNAGTRDNLRGMEAIRPQPGPLARHVEDLGLALKLLRRPLDDAMDMQTAPVPLGDWKDVELRGLRVGYWTDDGIFPTSPALVRAVREAVSTLSELGAEVVEFRPPLAREAVRLYFGLLSADGAADAARLLGSSPGDWRVKRLLALGKMPGWLRRILRRVARWTGQPCTAELLSMLGRQSADGYWRLSVARSAYAESFAAAWSAAGLDAIVCPPHALPAFRHGGSAHLALAGSNLYWANLLGVPAGVVPITRVLAHEQADRSPSRDIVHATAWQADADSFGLPVGVQVAGRLWREDVVLAVMHALQRHYSQTDDYPQTPVDPH